MGQGHQPPPIASGGHPLQWTELRRMHEHGPAPEVKAQLREPNNFTSRISENVQVGRLIPERLSPVEGVVVVKVMIARQHNCRDRKAAHLLQEKLQDSIGHSGVVENVSYDKESVAAQPGYAVHHSLQGRLSQLRMPVVAQMGV
jgi:hypothetical protein